MFIAIIAFGGLLQSIANKSISVKTANVHPLFFLSVLYTVQSEVNLQVTTTKRIILDHKRTTDKALPDGALRDSGNVF